MYDMYRENILDHGMNPRNRGVLDPADREFEGHNPLCGDRLHLTLRIDEDERITEVGWDGEGCAISQASASMLGERIIGMTLEEARQIKKDEIFELLGIPLSMNRIKCALLSLKVLKVAAYGLSEMAELNFDDDEEDE
mgnify:CR=1 FL=1